MTEILYNDSGDRFQLLGPAIEKFKDATEKCIAGLKEFNNATDLEFTDISSEIYRAYIFPGGETVRIENPLRLNVSKNGHRVFDANGVSHYMPQGWIHLYWQVKPGQPNFVR